MNMKKAVMLTVLVLLVAVTVIVAADIFTDTVDLGLGHVEIGKIGSDTDWDRYFGGITTVAILGTCSLISVAIMAATYYHRS